MRMISVKHIRIYEETHPALFAHLRETNAMGVPYSRALADAAERGLAPQAQGQAQEQFDVTAIARAVIDEMERRGLVAVNSAQVADAVDAADESAEETALINGIIDLF